jgi:hypothetical protein
LIGFRGHEISPEVRDLYPRLSVLLLGQCDITDLRPLAGIPLKRLGLQDVPVRDLSPLCEIPSLESLSILGSDSGLDLTPLIDSNLTELQIDKAGSFYGLDSLPRHVSVTRLQTK